MRVTLSSKVRLCWWCTWSSFVSEKIYIFEISRTHYYGEACWNLTWYFPSSIRMPKRSGAVGDSSNWVNYADMTECVAPVALFCGFFELLWCFARVQMWRCCHLRKGILCSSCHFLYPQLCENSRLIMTLDAVPCSSSQTCLIFDDAQIKCY